MARITNKGKTIIAQKQAAGDPLIIDRFIWAYIEELDHTQPVNPDEPMPNVAQIKHDNKPDQTGFVNPDLVVYSSILSTNVGDFKFNWIGLAAGSELIAANYLPEQYKLKTGIDNIGNTLNKNFAMQFKDAADTAGVTISADTWQIDYTASFDNIDERERLSNFDLYGRQTFVNDGFQVVKSGSDYHVKAGWGYVAGLRIVLNKIGVLPDVGVLQKNVFVDVVLNCGMAGKTADFKFIVSSDEKTDYVDSAGQQHFLEKIAVISAGVEDKRKTLDLNARETILERLQRQATEDEDGIIQIATGSEVREGADIYKAVTSKFLHEYITHQYDVYIDSESGNDKNIGSSSSQMKSIEAAIVRYGKRNQHLRLYLKNGQEHVIYNYIICTATSISFYPQYINQNEKPYYRRMLGESWSEIKKHCPTIKNVEITYEVDGHSVSTSGIGFYKSCDVYIDGIVIETAEIKNNVTILSGLIRRSDFAGRVEVSVVYSGMIIYSDFVHIASGTGNFSFDFYATDMDLSTQHPNLKLISNEQGRPVIFYAEALITSGLPEGVTDWTAQIFMSRLFNTASLEEQPRNILSNIDFSRRNK